MAFLETAYLCDPACLSRLLDTLHELRILPQLLAMSHSSFFTLDLASLASRRQHLNLEKWLAKAASDDGEFGQRIAGFLAYRRSAPHAPILSKETIRIFTEFMASKEPMSGGTLKASSMREKRHLPFEHPEHAGTSSDQSDIQFGHEIEDQVNACFEKLFTHEISVGDLLALLAAKRTSVEAADQNFFACLIHNLFDEYRFFPKYPENELLLTASLFGGIINEQLISSVPLSVAFRYILESLKKTPGQKLFKFGIHALYQFQEKLGMWPEFCNYILHTPHLHQTHPELISYIRHCLLSPPGQDAVAQGAGAQEGPVSFLQSGRIDEPDLLLRDKCLFHFNNLAQSNIEKKAGDVHALLWPKYRFWLANNVVVQRVCIEPNLHGLYIDFIDAFPDVAFERCVLDETYAAAHAALALKAEAPTPTERAAFKNLGAWLGLLTLARNRPVLMRELSLKDVLIEAFFGSRLDFVFTFVCKVLEQAADSIVFKPYNPWLMRHLSLLAEFYFFADLKLNMKFEVELLLKAFELDIKDVEPSFYLRALVEGDVPASHRSHAQAPSLHLPGSNVLMKFVNLQVPLLNSMDTNAALELLSYAVDFSAREIATGIADRAVSIARATSGFLASNDLSGYYDAPALESSLVSILTGLTKSLALVTAKEPLRQLLSQNILSFFSSSGASIPEQSVATLVADNLQLACALVVDYSNSTALSQANVLFSKFSVGGQPADLVAGIYSEYFGLIFPMFPGHDLKFKPVSSEEYGSLHHLIESISENAHEASSAAVLTSEAIFANEFGGVIDSLLALGSADVGGASLDEHVSLILARADELIAYHHAQKNDFGMSSCSLILSTLFSHSPSHLDAVFVALLSKIFDICPLQKQDFCRWFLATNSFLSVSPAVSKLFFTKNIFDTLEFDKRLSFKIALDRQLAVDSLRFIEKCISTSAVASIHDFSLCLKAIERLGLISGEFYSKLIQSHASSKFSQSLCTAFFTDWVRIHRFASPSSSCIENYLSRLFCEPILASASNASLFFQNCVEICIEFYARHDADALHAVDAFGLLTALFRRIILAQCSRSQLAALFEHFAVYLKVLGFYFVKCMEQSLDNVAYPIIRSIKSTLFFIDDSPLSEESKTHLLLIFWYCRCFILATF